MIYNYDNLNFKILSVERFFHKKGTFQVNGRVFGALSVRIKGEGAFEVQGKHFVSKPGDVIFIPRDVPYKADYTEGESIAIHFSECNYTLAENITPVTPGGVFALFENLLKLYGDGCSINKAKACVYEILDETDGRKGFKDDDFLRLVEYVRENFCDSKLDVESLCSAFFISKSTLQRKFNKYYNMSPKQYILQLRTQKALRLLVEGEQSVKEIAYACGFNDEKYFSRMMKHRFGRCPSEIS